MGPGGALDAELDAFVPLLLKRAGQASAAAGRPENFLAAEADRALAAVTAHTSEARSAAALLASLVGCRSPDVRAKIALHLEACLQRHGARLVRDPRWASCVPLCLPRTPAHHHHHRCCLLCRWPSAAGRWWPACCGPPSDSWRRAASRRAQPGSACCGRCAACLTDPPAAAPAPPPRPGLPPPPSGAQGRLGMTFGGRWLGWIARRTR